MKRLLSMLCAATILLALSPAVSAQTAWMAETESGESLLSLIDEAAPAWAADTETAADASGLQIAAKSAVLMDLSGGTILFEQDAHAPLPIASVTKVMTLLLIMEAIEGGKLNYDTMITCSTRASSMGGSQIWLKENEQMSLDDLLKAIAVVSANDACAAVAEHLCGTIEAFVAQMNKRAQELGMNDTTFVDCSGLSDDGIASAYDVAVMSRELMRHADITRYTTIWMDSIRGGQSQLVNTNKLVRFYSGATGLKTGTTGASGHCLSATAERNGMGLCAVVLGCSTTQERFGGARSLLDFGFANYGLYVPQPAEDAWQPVPVLHGMSATVTPQPPETAGVLVEKGRQGDVKTVVTLATDLEAPVMSGQTIGEMTLTLDGQTIAAYPVTAAEEVPRMSFGAALGRLFGALVTGNLL